MWRVALLVFLVALPTLRTIASGPAIAVAGPSDLLSQNLPKTRAYGEHLRTHGGIPLYRATEHYGVSLPGDPQERLLYPPMLLHAALPAPLGQHVFWLVHALVLALGTYGLLREERCRPEAALGGALAIGLSWKRFAYELASWENIFGAAAWTPLALLLFRRAVRTRAWPRPAALLGAVLALGALAGTPTFIVYLPLGLPLAALVGRRALAVAGLAALVAALLAAPVLLPALETSAASARGGLARNYGTLLTADVLGALAVPDLSRQDFSWERSNSLGLLALPLAGAGIAARKGRFYPVLALLFLVFAAGPATPIGAALGHLPVVSRISYPSRLLWVVAVAEAALVGFGLDALLRGTRRRLAIGLAAGSLAMAVALVVPGRAERLPGVGAPLLGLALALLAAIPFLPRLGKDGRRRAVLALVALIAVELIAWAERGLERVPWEPLVRPGRIEAELRAPGTRLLAVTESSFEDPVLPLYLTPGVERADGYNPLHSREVRDHLLAIAGEPEGKAWELYTSVPRVARLDLLRLGVTHVASRRPVPGLEVALVETRTILAPDGRTIEGPVYLARVPGTQPRASIDGHPMRIAVHEPHRVVVEVDRGGTLVLLDAFTPGWAALVDGEKVPIERAHGLFRAVRVPAGARRVELRAVPPRPLVLGILLAGVGAGILVFALRTRRPAAPTRRSP